jgi:diguanylate cyclase (GGDEF)-like protein
MIARYGGEEFVALLPATDASGVGEVAEKLRTAVEELAIAHQYSSAASVVTLSIGCATYSPGDPDDVLDGLLKSGDEALYRAKKAGRNRCACDGR